MVVYATTEQADSACPEVPERGPEGRYVWPIYPTYDLVLHNLNTNEKNVIAASSSYDAEATVSPKGDRMVFTSTRNGDLDLYTCDLDGRNVRQVTNTLGYDGGAFFLLMANGCCGVPQGPKPRKKLRNTRLCLSKTWWNPPPWNCLLRKRMVPRRSNHNARRGELGTVFSEVATIVVPSNHKTGRFPFNIFMINLDGSGLEQITLDEAFDSFHVLVRRQKLAFSSNRNGRTRNTNVFVADWVGDGPCIVHAQQAFWHFESTL